MKIAKEDLKQAIEILALVPVRPGIQSSEFIKVEQHKGCITLALSSDILGEVRLTSAEPFPVKTPFFIDRRLFMPFVATDTDSAFRFEASPTNTAELVVVTGTRKAEFIRLSEVPEVAGYGQILEGPDLEEIIFTKEQQEFLQCAASFATPDTMTPHLNCVVLENDMVMSTSGTSIFIGSATTAQAKIILPLYIIGLLSNKKIETISWSKTSIVLRFSCGSLLQSLPVKAITDFPVSRLVTIRDKHNYLPVLEIDAQELVVALERFKTYTSGWTRHDRTLAICGKKGDDHIDLSSGVPHLKVSENLLLSKPLRSDFDIDLSLDDLLPAFKFLASRKDNLVKVSYSDKDRSPYCFSVANVLMFFSRKAQTKPQHSTHTTPGESTQTALIAAPAK